MLSFSITNSNQPYNLVDIREIPEKYREIFINYPSFNKVQSRVFYDVVHTDTSIVISAPTGAGKTVIFELAIVRSLRFLESSNNSKNLKIIYICPMKALCEERLIDWHKKFSSFGVNCISVTGDSDLIDFNDLLVHYNIIITTPEKWDSITRKWRDHKDFILAVKLFMIDEIHLLGEENRGATLEAMVCRMKHVQTSIHYETGTFNGHIRFLAASATFPNVQNAAEWLCNAKCFIFGENYRPVKLNTMVLGYSFSKNCAPFKFDMMLNYKLSALILRYSNGKPTLIFCSTRKSVEMASTHLSQTLSVPLSQTQKDTLRIASNSIADAKLKPFLIHGIGYHHGGLLAESRGVIEELFRNGGLPVLITTSTLAMGVNLPAHLVIIKSTKCYGKGGYTDYTPGALSQMIGRAGRPQFDSEATALILTTNNDKEKFAKMIDGKQDVESNLHRHFIEHLNAEIVLKTITDLDGAMKWLSSTFLYIRARENPKHYGIPSGMSSEKIDKKLLEMCQIDLNKLVKAELVSMDGDMNIYPKFLGILMAKFYMSFESMKLFQSITGNEILPQLLSIISKCHEFSDIRLRVDEKKCLNFLNKNNKDSIRFPLSGKVKTLDMKINCITQAIFGCLEIEEHSIISESFRIMRLGERICRCLVEFLETKENNYFSALINSIILWKCFRTKLWDNSHHVAKQFVGIGAVASKHLVNAGKTSFDLISKCNPREIELICKKKSPFGNKLLEMVKGVPKFNLKHEKVMENGRDCLRITINFLNPECLENSTLVNSNSVMCLLVGDDGNNVLLYERYTYSYLDENVQIIRVIEIETQGGKVNEIDLNFISEDIVGVDLNETFIINPNLLKLNQPKTPIKSSINNNLKKKEVTTPSLKLKTPLKTDKKSKEKNEKSENSKFKTLDKKFTNILHQFIDKHMNRREIKNSEAPENLSEHLEIKIPKSDDVEIETKSECSFDEEIPEGLIEFLEQTENVQKEKETTEKIEPEEVKSETEKTLACFECNEDNEDIYKLSQDLPSLFKKYDNKQEPPEEIQKPIPEIQIQSKRTDKSKLISAVSFEDEVMGHQKSLNSFRCQPKQLTHAPNSNSMSLSSRKRKLNDSMFDEAINNLGGDGLNDSNDGDRNFGSFGKSIKWRSPLVHSPQVKFSPKMSTSFSFTIPMPNNNINNNNDSENSHDWSTNTLETSGTSSKNFKNVKMTPKRMFNENTRISMRPNTNESFNNSHQLEDFVVLENFGLSASTKKTRTSNYSGIAYAKKSNELNASDYYDELLTKSQCQYPNTGDKSHFKSFYLSQNNPNPNPLIPKTKEKRENSPPPPLQVEKEFVPQGTMIAPHPQTPQKFMNPQCQWGPQAYYNSLPNPVPMNSSFMMENCGEYSRNPIPMFYPGNPHFPSAMPLTPSFHEAYNNNSGADQMKIRKPEATIIRPQSTSVAEEFPQSYQNQTQVKSEFPSPKNYHQEFRNNLSLSNFRANSVPGFYLHPPFPNQSVMNASMRNPNPYLNYSTFNPYFGNMEYSNPYFNNEFNNNYSNRNYGEHNNMIMPYPNNFHQMSENNFPSLENRDMNNMRSSQLRENNSSNSSVGKKDSKQSYNYFENMNNMNNPIPSYHEYVDIPSVSGGGKSFLLNKYLNS